MVERIDIERALEDLISNEEGMRFQGLAVALAQQRWPELIACERHNDLGLDAYASPNSSPNGIGKGLACSITATFGKIGGDARTAKEHYGPFTLLVFATPRKVTKDAEKEWADKVRDEFALELVVISRAEIIASLQVPANAWMCRTHLRIAVPYQSPITDTLRLIREAATEEADLWAIHARLSGKPRIELSAARLANDGEGHDFISTPQLHSWLTVGRKVILEASAGQGKTTTLIQLAQTAYQTGGMPILIDLPRWIQSGLYILEFIAGVPSFRGRGINATALAQAFRDEPLQLLLNGWNEISSLHSDQATSMLRSLVRSFPGAGIIVATRAHHITPSLPDATRVRLLPLSPQQRLKYLVEALGSTRAHALHSVLIDDRVLGDLTTTPFILSGVTALVQAGQTIPRTRLALIRAITALVEQSEEHGSQLQGPPLRGQADHYFRALASHLTGHGAVLLPETEARAICMSVAEHLRVAGQIASTPEPADILTALTSHHLLDRIEGPTVNYRFEHQQFQEFYAALALSDALAGLPQDDLALTDDFVSRYINDPAWEEPVCMVAEDLGTLSANAPAGNLLIAEALRVDPVFSATLARLVGPSVRTQVRAELSQRLRSLYTASESQYRQLALAAMLATGSDEFSDILVPLLTNSDQQVRLATYRAGRDFHPSSLGPDWAHIVSLWTEELRTEFVSELTLHHRQSEVAMAFVRTDPSEKVRLEALRALIWIGQWERVAELFQLMPDAEFASAVRQFHTEEIPKALHARAISTYKSLLDQTDDPRSRIQVTLALAELNDRDTPDRLKAELDRLPEDIVQDLSGYALRPAIEIVRGTDPQWVSAWITRHIITGALWSDHWISLVQAIDPSLRDQLLKRVCTEDLRQSRSGGVIAILEAAATPDSAKTLFGELRDRQPGVYSTAATDVERSIYHQIQRLLRNLPASVTIEGLSEILERPAQAEELAIIADLFSPPNSTPQVDLRSVITDRQRQELRFYFISAVPMVLAQDDFRGDAKGHFSTALAEVGEPNDATHLMELIRSDIARVKLGRAARARGEQTARAHGSPMCWSGWHVQALVRLLNTDSEPFLLDLLNEPDYELDAAWGLVIIAQKDKPKPNAITAARHGNPDRDYRTIRSVPALDWSAGFDDAKRQRYAIVIGEHINVLLAETRDVDQSTIPFHFRLKELAKVLATLDPWGSTERILDIAELTSRFDGWKRLGLLEPLVFAGLSLPTDRTIGILDPIVQQFRTHGLNNDGHLLTRLLCLLPFTDDPPRGIAKMSEWLAEFGMVPHSQRNLLMALARCGDDAGLDLLHHFAIHNSPIFQHSAREWIEAVSACDLPGARTILLSFVDPDLQTAGGGMVVSDYAVDFLAARIAELARSEESVTRRIFELTVQPQSQHQRNILVKVIASLDSHQALMAGLNLIADAGANPIPYELRKGIEDLVLEKRHYKGSQSYRLAPRAANEIKKRLFQMLRHDPTRARTAYHLLGQIEEWRLEYGRPASEPRHPALDSGEYWPPAIP